MAQGSFRLFASVPTHPLIFVVLSQRCVGSLTNPDAPVVTVEIRANFTIPRMYNRELEKCPHFEKMRIDPMSIGRPRRGVLTQTVVYN